MKWKIEPLQVGVYFLTECLLYIIMLHRRDDYHEVDDSRSFTGMTGLVDQLLDTVKSMQPRRNRSKKSPRQLWPVTRGPNTRYEKNINDTWNFQLLSNSLLTRSMCGRRVNPRVLTPPPPSPLSKLAARTRSRFRREIRRKKFFFNFLGEKSLRFRSGYCARILNFMLLFDF